MSKFRVHIGIYCVIQRFSKVQDRWYTIRTVVAKPSEFAEIEDFDATEIKNLLNTLTNKTNQKFLSMLNSSYRKEEHNNSVRKLTDFLEVEK